MDDFAISPDGRSVAIRGLSGNGSPQLWVRPLDSLRSSRVAWNRGRELPVLVARQPVYRLLRERQAEEVGRRRRTSANVVRRGKWTRRGLGLGRCDRLLASQPKRAEPGFGRRGHPGPGDKSGPGQRPGYLRFPVFLPDGRRFLYSNIAGTSPGIYLGSLDSSTARRIAPDLSKAAVHAAGGRVAATAICFLCGKAR